METETRFDEAVTDFGQMIDSLGKGKMGDSELAEKFTTADVAGLYRQLAFGAILNLSVDQARPQAQYNAKVLLTMVEYFCTLTRVAQKVAAQEPLERSQKTFLEALEELQKK